jgi:hypothetical protein
MITHGIIKDIGSKLRDSMLRIVPYSNVEHISDPYSKPANMDYVICSIFDLMHQE